MGRAHGQKKTKEESSNGQDDNKQGLKGWTEAVRGQRLHEPISHYTDAVQFGDLLFISGVAPLDEKLGLVGGSDPAEQARQVFRHME
jgi:enamine deaminase RidA (YjgF/YER057c/UK114 family)